MVYKLINFLGMILIASFFGLAANATLVAEDLIYQTVKQLEKSLFHELNEPSFANVPCHSLGFRNVGRPTSQTTTDFPKRSRIQASALSRSVIEMPGTAVQTMSKRPLANRPNGGFIFRVEPKTNFQGEQMPVDKLVPLEHGGAGHSTTAARRVAKRETSRKLNGSLIFRIDAVSESASTNNINIDPVLLPNYPLQQDAYWQYYADCDQWNIVFNQGMGLQPDGFLEMQQASKAAPFIQDTLAAVASTRSFLARKTIRLSHSASHWIQSGINQVHQSLNSLAIVEIQPLSDVRADKKQLNPLRDIKTHTESNPLPTISQMVFHHLMSTEFLFSPQRCLDRCLDRCLHSLQRNYGETLVGSGIGEFVRRINQKHKINQTNQIKNQIKLTRGIANRLNWLAFQLHRAAVAVGDSAEEQLESVAESDQSVHY